MARYFLFMDYLERAHAEDMRRLRRKRKMLRDVCDAFDLPDKAFEDRYRLTKPLVRGLVEELKPFLKSSRRRDMISADTKVLTALAFYATGSYQRLVGEGAHISLSQPTVSNIIREVTNALNTPSILHKYIKFPLTREEREKIKREFYNECGIPGVVGCVDGTHIAIIRPTHNEERFFNRKQYHSLNVQIICDSDLNILSVDASYPGATNDATVWQMHPLYNYLLECRRNGETLWVLGDSGYPQRKHTMTPILNTEPGSKESLYTKMHTSARNCVERCIGVLKARFRCLLVARTLHYEPETAARIVNACCVLHNIAHGARLIQPTLSEEEQQHEQQQQINRVHHEEVTHTRGHANYERWYIYKPPSASIPYLERGQNFTYITPATAGRWQFSETYLSSNSMLYHTMSPLFRMSYLQYIAIAAYEHKEDGKSAKIGNSAYGIMIADEMGGAWIGHSVPGLLDLKNDRPTFPRNETTKGHLLVCLSLDLVTLNKMGATLKQTGAKFTTIHIPPTMKERLPLWNILNFDLQLTRSSSPSTFEFNTHKASLRGYLMMRQPGDTNCLFEAFAKKYDIYLDVYNHRHNRKPICEQDYGVRNIDSISVKGPYYVNYIQNTADRATFAVSTTAHWQRTGSGPPQFWACVGSRSDGTTKEAYILCVQQEKIWTSFDNFKVREPEC